MAGQTRRLVGWIIGFAFVATAVIVAASMALRVADGNGGPGGGASGPHPDATVPPMLAPTGEAAVVPSERIVVQASTFLPPADTITYDPENTIDGDENTAWNSDAPETDGRGEHLTFRFTEPVDLQAIRFVNGYPKTADIYAANHRVREVRVTTDSGSQTVNLLDTSDVQQITHAFGHTTKVVLEVIEIYPGSRSSNPAITADLALAEVSFVAVQR